MAKIYLSPAYHRFNPCAISGCDETTHNNAYLDELEPYLKACGIEYKRGPRRISGSNEDGTELMYQAVKESNDWGADLHYISHTNACNGEVRGYRPMIYSHSAENDKIANIMMKYRAEIYGEGSVLSCNPDLYELNSTKAIAFYEEHVFHDNLEDATWFHDNLRKIAEFTCRGFCEYFGISFVDPYYVPPKADTFYRVYTVTIKEQVGAFNSKENAEKKINELKDKGENAIIVEIKK
jgi:hypothetical protein